MSEGNSAYQALVAISQQVRQSAKGLPSQVDITPHWSGVGFSLMGHRFVVPMGQITEMLEVPSYTRLPSVQRWVRGVANVRGRLLPIFDLADFFNDKLAIARKPRRILVLESDDLYSGLMVDAVFGMQHFPIDTFSTETSEVPESLWDFVAGSYGLGKNRWSLFDIEKLAQDPRFINAAVG